MGKMKEEDKEKEVKLYRFHNFGAHSFDRYNHQNIIDLSNIEEVPRSKLDYASSCNNQINTYIPDNKDEQKRVYKIFIYGEYIKRKFYLDSLKDNSCLLDKKQNYYVQKKFKSYKEIEKDTADIFVAPDRRAIFCQNLPNFRYKQFMPPIKNFNRYIYIKRLFYFFINKIKNVLVYPRKYLHFISLDDIEFIERAFSNKRCSIYLCERLLYSFSDPNSKEQMNTWFNYYKGKNNKNDSFLFYKLNEILTTHFWTFFPESFLILYRGIINKYSLYMYELFNISDMDYIIKNNFIIEKLPRFFFLPKEPIEDDYASKNVNIQFIPSKKKILIDINLDYQIDTIAVTKYVNDSLMSAIYQHKQNLELGYSIDEISFFNKFIDFNNKHNNTDTIEERIYGLYMWDKLNRPFSKNTISWATTHMIKKYHIPGRSSKQATEKKFSRIYNSTRKSIEQLEYLPLK